MNTVIALFVLCLSIFTQALSAPADSDVALVETQPANAQRDASILPDNGHSIPACWTALTCTFNQIEEMSLSTRLRYVQYMETRFIPLNAGNQFRAIEGVLKFFISKELGGPGTWVSYVDAGIVESIQRGGAIALGIGKSEGGNPGSPLWAEFLTKMKKRELEDRNVSCPCSSSSLSSLLKMRNLSPRPSQNHDHAWSISEQTATEYGMNMAESITTVDKASKQQLSWYRFIQLFRAIMRNRKTVTRTISM